MTQTRRAVSALGLAVVLGFTYYVFTAPYTRFPGVRIGGQLTPPPADWSTVNGEKLALLKLEGVPPFVIHVWTVGEAGGIITATRPDAGYWAKRVRSNPNGWIRLGESKMHGGVIAAACGRRDRRTSACACYRQSKSAQGGALQRSCR